jgi:hypothetical protein
MQTIRTRSKQKVGVLWVVQERLVYPISHREVWVPVARGKNIMTSYGLTALASAFGGTYTVPQYLVIENGAATIQNVSGILAGATSVTVDAQVHQTGDTEIILGLGDVSQEKVTFSAYNSGTKTYTISACASAHANGQYVVRAVRAADTMTSVTSEIQYDATNFPGKRVKQNGWLSTGTGNSVMEFFLTGNQALTHWQTLGLSDSDTVGAGNLHNHIVLGYNHQTGNDAKVDISLTLANA